MFNLACCMSNMTHLHLRDFQTWFTWIQVSWVKNIVFSAMWHVVIIHQFAVNAWGFGVQQFDRYKMSCCLNDCDEFSRLTPAKPKVIFPTQNTTQSQSNMWQTAPPQSEKISYSYCPLIQIEKFCSSSRMKLTGFAIEMFANETLIQNLILMKKNERLENERQVEAFANFFSLWWV